MASHRGLLGPTLALAFAWSALPSAVAAQSPPPSAIPDRGQPAASTDANAVPLALAGSGLMPLEGTTWRLAGYGGGLREPGPEVASWLTLRAGRMTGSGGCTPLRGRYARIGAAIAIQLQRPPRTTCAARSVAVQRAMLAALQRAASAEVVEEGGAHRLVIRDADGEEMLRFEPDDLAPLEGAEWRLAAYVRDGEALPADPDQAAVLALRPERASAAQRRSSGEAIGSSGCNGFVASYARSGDVLRIDGLEATDAPCPEVLAAQESAVLGVLESDPLRLDLPADRLTLTATESGDRLEYVASVPLEDTTWQLERAARAGRPSQPVTLRLADGVISGQGPCGPYGGTYASDGRFITLRDLEPSGRAGCPRADVERALLADLAAAVLVERSRPGLRLLDARGRVVARFSTAAAGP